jgi:hypothetical protein
VQNRSRLVMGVSHGELNLYGRGVDESQYEFKQLYNLLVASIGSIKRVNDIFI